MCSSNSNERGMVPSGPVRRQRQCNRIVGDLAGFDLSHIEQEAVQRRILASGFGLESIQRTLSFVRHRQGESHRLSGS